MITEQNAKDLGYSLFKEYDHDEFNTRVFKNKDLLIEFTYQEEELHTCELLINVEEVYLNNISLLEAELLTKIILNNTTLKF